MTHRLAIRTLLLAGLVTVSVAGLDLRALASPPSAEPARCAVTSPSAHFG
jgi:hypothetical protein